MTILEQIYSAYDKISNKESVEYCFISVKNYHHLSQDFNTIRFYKETPKEIPLNTAEILLRVRYGTLHIKPCSLMRDDNFIFTTTIYEYEKIKHNHDFYSKIGDIINE